MVLSSDVTEDGRLNDETLAGGGEMGALMRRLDWSHTPVGPAAEWPQSLRTAVSILLASRFPMIIFWGPELVQFYNDAYRPILGAKKHPAAQGQRARACWPEIWDVIEPMLTGVITTGEATWSDNQLLLLDRNGYVEECYFTFSYSPIRVEQGAVGGVFCAVTETTAQVLAERRLRALSDLASGAAAATVDQACADTVTALQRHSADLPFAALYLVDETRATARLVGTAGVDAGSLLAPSQLTLQSASAEAVRIAWPATGSLPVIPDCLIEGVVDPALAPAGQALPAERVLVLPVAQTGRETPIAVLVAGVNPRHALDDVYRGFLELVASQVATALDRARGYQEARERAEALAELDRAKTVFFSNVSHEFRTPLTLLLAPVEDALADKEAVLPAVQRDRLEIVHRNGLRLLRLVNTLLDFSRLEAGRLQARYRPTDLATLTLEFAAAFHSAVEQAGLRYLVSCPPLPEPVYVDREMYEKIVFNLLSNAFKFTLAGEISVALRAGDGGAELTIRDTGAGIPEEAMPRLFERFYRFGGAPARIQEGTGIGLALVRELTALHGGTVAVTSVLGVGTSFTVRLPFGTGHLRPDWIDQSDTADAVGPVSSSPTMVAAAPHSRIPAAVPSARVLLVDDNADMRRYLDHLLGAYWEVEAVADGTAALTAARERCPDLVLSDVMMPGLDGFQLLQALRSDRRTRNVPVILLSARAGEEAMVEGLDAGADDYLIKPFTARELVARVRTHLGLAAARAETACLREQALVEAQEALRVRDEFLTTAAHDLKNPLTTIQGYAQLLRRHLARDGGPDSGRLLSGLTQIETTVATMRAQIEELRDLAQLQTGRPLDLQRELIDLVDLTRRVAAAQQETADGHQIEVVAAVSTLAGMWDPGRLRRVVTNLLDNAIKYSPALGLIRVEVGPDTTLPAHARLTVRDSGVGIPAEDLPYIFERHRRARNVEHVAGSGVGLASARQIVEQHGGRIVADSREGAGSVFTVCLPLEPPG